MSRLRQAWAAIQRQGPATRVLPLLAGIALLAGCSADGFSTRNGADDLNAEIEARSQTILVVGTDPQDLRTSLYIVRAVTPSTLSGEPLSQEEPVDLLAVDDFEIEAFAALSPGAESSPLQSSADTLFGDELPFAVPDRTGAIVGALGLAADRSVGRLALYWPEDATSLLSPDIDGLISMHFSWNSGWVIFERENPEHGGTREILVQRVDELSLDPIPLGPSDPNLAVTFAGLDRESDRFLAIVEELSSGRSTVVLLDPETGSSNDLTGFLQDDDSTAWELVSRVDSASLSPDRSLMALTTVEPGSGRREVSVLVDPLGMNGETTVLSPTSDDCRWPVWAPSNEKGGVNRLAFACHSQDIGKPDILLATLQQGIPPSLDDVTNLTEGHQPNLDESTLSDMVIRSAPRWDPLGEFLVFGASTLTEASDGEGMSLLAVRSGEHISPIWNGDEASAGWAHFSAAASASNMLLWDRATSGLYDSQGEHPIHVVPTQAEAGAARAVVLGEDLLLSYPLFLGANAMLYP